MPDKECTISLLELAFAVGQLRANPTKNKEHVGAMGEILSGWECRKSGDDGKAFDGLQKAVDTGAKGTGVATPTQVDNIFKEYHSLLFAMGYLNLEQIDQPKRSPVPSVGFKDGELQLTDFRLESTGSGRKAFTDYRQVKVAKPTPPETPETPPEPAAPKPPRTTGYNMHLAQCRLTEEVVAIEKQTEKVSFCAAKWNELTPRQKTTWNNRASKANEAAKAEFEAANPSTAAWGYGSEKKRRGASRWTPQNARNSILR